MLPWIAEFDRREGWAGTGLLSCAHWLAWKVGLSLGAAREQVRVARRLEELPSVAAAYRAGRVSYSKVRAITRVAEPEDGIDWVEHARHSTASQLDDVPAETPVASEPEPEPEPKLHAHHVRSWVDGGGTDLGNLVKHEYVP